MFYEAVDKAFGSDIVPAWPHSQDTLVRPFPILWATSSCTLPDVFSTVTGFDKHFPESLDSSLGVLSVTLSCFVRVCFQLFNWSKVDFRICSAWWNIMTGIFILCINIVICVIRVWQQVHIHILLFSYSITCNSTHLHLFHCIFLHWGLIWASVCPGDLPIVNFTVGKFSKFWEWFIWILSLLMPFSLFLSLRPSLLFFSFLFFPPYYQRYYRWSKSFQSSLPVAGC